MIQRWGGGIRVHTLLLFDQSGKCAETSLRAAAPLPGLRSLPLTCGELFAGAHTSFGWADLRALAALETFHMHCDLPFRVTRAFSVPAASTRHGSGVSFDLAVPGGRENAQLRSCALKSRLFHRVDPEYLSPRCVHVDCLPRPVLRVGDAGVFVCVLQSALLACGCCTEPVTGIFSAGTRRAVLRFQRQNGLPETGIADEWLWHAIGGR